MANKNFLLLSLDDEETKQVANVVSNKSSKRILEYLTEKDATESEIAKALKIPISTVHYNLEQLQKAGLVVVEEYHYSEKGKEVNHYKLANKYIIIAPKGQKADILSKIKDMIPSFAVSAGLAGLLYYFVDHARSVANNAMAFGGAPEMASARMAAAPMAKEAAEAGTGAASEGLLQSAPVASDMAVESANMMADGAGGAIGYAADYAADEAMLEAAPMAAQMMHDAGPLMTEPTTAYPIAMWFMLGAVAAMAVYFLVSVIRKK